MNLPQRIYDKIFPEPNTGCWLWTGSLNASGYGTMKLTDSKQTSLVHRFVYKQLVSDIPAGLVVCHTCDVRSCVNPAHLFLGTVKDNSDDMIRKGRSYNRFGSNNPRAILTESDVKSIRSMYTSGIRKQVIADTFGVKFCTVDDIIYKRSWKEIA